MKKIHIALSTSNIEGSVKDYSQRLNTEPCIVIPNAYALWRTESINLSIRQDKSVQPGQLRHLGWEDTNVSEFTQDTDINGIIWERFNAENQADEINETWPEANYTSKD